MAETALVSVAGGIINSLVAPQVKEQICLLWGFKKELQKLESTVSTIQAVLQDAEERQSKSHAIIDWLGKLTDALYEADDLLDSVFSEALQRKVMTQGKKGKKVRVFFSKLVRDLIIANKIKDVREKLDAIADERRFHLEERPVETRVTGRETYSYLGEKQIIGREDDKKAVIERLEANADTNVSIFSIIGIGGLGKTALAQLIYNDQDFTRKFHLKMWVCVSDDFDVKIIARKILGFLTKEKPRDETIDALVELLSKTINDQRYLLILDDVWNEDSEKWWQLKDLLGGRGNSGSRIIVTTRSTRVAQIMHSEYYKLNGLGKDASWQLFKQLAFENEEESIDPVKQEIGMEVVKKCAGAPLALRSLGGLLHSKDLEYWVAFKDKELSTISPNDETNDIIPTLKLSYNRLPSRLKQCFVYCCLFPKDFEYDKITLISLWIVQGFIEPKSNQCLEDTGNDYFMILLSGSFFQEPKMDNLGNIVECKMHDLMHDLAMSMSGSLIATVGDKVRINISNKTRFVSFNDDTDFSSLKHSSFEASKIRTFICPTPTRNIFTQPKNFKHINCGVIFSMFEHLRVLDLNNRQLVCLPSSISKLKQLRDLNLSGNPFKQLPESIMLLQNLQTLNLRDCYLLEKLPSGIAKLINLRCLYLDSCHNLSSMPRGLGQLTNLHRLDSFVVNEGPPSNDSSSLDELNGLVNLRGNLTICHLGHARAKEYESADLSQISRLSGMSLEWLEFYGGDNDEVAAMSFKGLQPSPNLKILELSGYPFSELPSWISSLTSLVILEVNFCTKCQYLTPLSQLRSLKYLELFSMDNLEYVSKYRDTRELSSSSSSSPVFFPMLDTLELNFCRKLKGLWEADSSTEGESDDTITEVASLENLKFVHPIQHLTKLKHLAIVNCPNVELDNDENGMEWQGASPLQTLNITECDSLRAIPKWVENCKTLQVLEIERCSRFNSQRCKKETGEDWPKIVHIPKVVHVVLAQKQSSIPKK